MSPEEFKNLKPGDRILTKKPGTNEPLKTIVIAVSHSSSERILFECYNSGNFAENYSTTEFSVLPEYIGRRAWAKHYSKIELIYKLSKVVEDKAKDFGRWLSGIDQYSDNNYQRGSSGFNWL